MFLDRLALLWADLSPGDHVILRGLERKDVVVSKTLPPAWHPSVLGPGERTMVLSGH